MRKSLLFSILLGTLAFFTACKGTSGEKAEVSEATEVAAAEGVTYGVDVASSKVMWEGSKPAGKHFGTVNVADGSVTVKDGTITAGSVTLDMNSITVNDLEGDYKANLEAHLKGTNEDQVNDFFNVNAYPTATFEITKVTVLSNDPDATHLIYGNLTMKETSKEVGFKAKVEMADGNVKISTPQFTIDRTQWGIKYGSPTFFENLKEKAISNDIGLQLDITATGMES